jgi:2-haloacid dehalogenase
MRRVRDGEREWVNLDQLHRESLDALLARHGVEAVLDEEARERLVRAWHRLPAWEDTVAGLARLRTRYVTATLSNGGFALLTHLVKAARLPFDCVLSAELVRAYKPDPRVYRSAADLLAVTADQVLLVAAHWFDLDGAAAAGLRTAFLERPREKGPDRDADHLGGGTSDLSVSSFVELADALGC